MNGPSKITADYSSIVGLKAELLRKRLEAQELKNKTPTQNVPKHKPKVKEIKIPKEKEKTPKIIEIEDINLLKKSKLMLEAKSKLYDKLKNSPRNKNDLYLVDFGNKSETESENSDEEEFRKRSKYEKKESEIDEDKEDEFPEQNYDSDDNFVEYKDCFGRTRKCLREDLPKMQDKDNLLKQQISKEPIVEKPPPEVEIQPEAPQLEPEIEIMRKKWEEQTNRLTNKDNIYYQDVLFDEARTHGVGYYNFSIDEEQRAKQQQNLEKLRKETEQKQQEMQNLKEMRQKMEQNRLKVARIRQRIRAGLPPELPEEEDNKSVKNSDVDNLNPVETGNSSESKDKNIGENKKESSEVNSLAIIEDKVKAFGELLGKRPPWREMSQEEWVHKRRRDRINEFAPNYDNFKRAGVLVTKNNSDIYRQNSQRSQNSTEIPPVPLVSEHQDEDSDDSEIIGPMPAFIPLPPNPPLSTIPLPPSPKESTSNSFLTNSKTKIPPIDSNSIEAGLKYLRAKFEENEKS
ncbi:coiled-coil domain-containing protein 174 [Leptopilina heterotoma]|uniref:coiled-coil domain-containing protein 174 n=1 Tax=Leptopilina heterotoma TaxID=63436 RepID=UPI001CA8D5A1|nr:coiled-coil domain-containing protein 174 [Leptopilina heterotoma]